MLYIQTPVVNNPKFIEMQHMTLKRFIKDDYRFVVYNDAKDWPDFSNHYDASIRKEIMMTCERLNIECINISNDHHRKLGLCASDRTADVCNTILKDQIKNNGKSLMIDSDMFIVDEVNICEKYADYDLAAVSQIRKNLPVKKYNVIMDVEYYWNGLAYFDIPNVKNKHLLNWNGFGGRCGLTDTGGETFYHIYETPDSKRYNIKHLSSCAWNKKDWDSSCSHLNPVLLDFLENDPRRKNGTFFSEIYDGYIFHYRAGGNWEQRDKDVHTKCTDMLWNTLVSIVKE